jgi:hypothetical protein
VYSREAVHNVARKSRDMQESADTDIDAVYITERVNGWWVSIRYQSGEEVHHGPYLDEDSARDAAEQFEGEPEKQT